MLSEADMMVMCPKQGEHSFASQLTIIALGILSVSITLEICWSTPYCNTSVTGALCCQDTARGTVLGDKIVRTLPVLYVAPTCGR